MESLQTLRNEDMFNKLDKVMCYFSKISEDDLILNTGLISDRLKKISIELVDNVAAYNISSYFYYSNEVGYDKLDLSLQ